MSNLISGNCGLAGATVYLTGAAGATTTADGSGNYSFSGLAAGFYAVNPQVNGKTFTPWASPQIIVSSDITGVNFTVATTPATSNIWVKLGAIVGTNASDARNALEPSVIYEGNAQILSGNVFKMWYTVLGGANPGVYYAESLTGLPGTWTQYSSNPVIAGYEGSSVFKDPSGTYNYYGTTNYFGTPMDRWTSSDGITFSKTNTAVLASGAAGTWDHIELWRLLPIYVDGGGTWWATYSALGTITTGSQGIGILTSSDGHTWSKYAGNPVLSNFASVQVSKIGSTFYAIGDYCRFGLGGSEPYIFPSPLVISTATNLDGPWSTPVPFLDNTISQEGNGPAPNSQVDSGFLVQGPQGQTLLFYGNTAAGSAVGNGYSISVAQTNQSLTSVFATGATASMRSIAGSQLASDNFQRANENPLSDGGNFTAAFAHAMQVVSDVALPTLINTSDASQYSGIVWPNDQYSEVTAGTGWKAGAGANYIVPMVRIGGTTGSPNAYVAFVENTGTVFIQKYVAGVNTNLHTVSPNLLIADGDVFRLSVVGTTLNFYQNGFLVYSLTDASLSSGNAGFGANAVATLSLAPISLWAGGSATNATPVISPVAGTYSNPTITITSASPGVNIYYTLDGSTPSSSSALYTGPFVISTSLTVKAIAIFTGYTNSSVASAAYTVTSGGSSAFWLMDLTSIEDVRRHNRR
jgi:Fn3 associated